MIVMMIFLRRLRFGPRPGFHAALDQLAIVLQEIDRDDGRPGNEDETVQPCLPVVQRSRRHEEQNGEKQYRSRRSEQRVAGEIAIVSRHVFSLASSFGDQATMLSYLDEALDFAARCPLKAIPSACG